MTSAAIEPIRAGDATLRLLGADDLPTTLAWRNHPDSRAWFHTSQLIEPDAHAAWFDGYLKRDDDIVFILEKDGVPVAQVALYRIDAEARTAEFGRVLVDPAARGQGLSHVLTRLAVAAARAQGLASLVLEVKESNDRAIRAYEAAGFRREGEPDDGTVHMSFDLRGAAEGM